MVEERVILTKYGELCVDYKNKHIDDFDNYVRRPAMKSQV